jgi:diguanylate cyclase (GGDEF)-like protein
MTKEKTMKKPDIPFNEISRLAVLASLGVLDTDRDEKLDRITRIAKKTFNVPIALISLVDENRQWFKSCFGLDVNETSRDISFCGHAILGRDIFVIRNAAADERFHDNPLVTGAPHIRFYAGCPIRIFGENIGTLCIIDSRERGFDEDDKAALRDLASLVEEKINASQDSNVDFLTHIHNRKGFVEIAKKALRLCRKDGIESSLCFMDLNGFKEINDKYGHDEGDRVLISFSNIIRKESRDSDIVGRLGGDEFVVWLYKSGETAACQYIERVKETIKNVYSSLEKPYRVDFAHGIVEISGNSDIELEDAFKTADAEMYKNKGKERNPRRGGIGE